MKIDLEKPVQIVYGKNKDYYIVNIRKIKKNKDFEHNRGRKYEDFR